MTPEEKIAFAEYILRYLQDNSSSTYPFESSTPVPVMVGTLNKIQSLRGFKIPEIGHPVFETRDRYIIYLDSNDGKTTVAVPYYKESLKPVIDFI